MPFAAGQAGMSKALPGTKANRQSTFHSLVIDTLTLVLDDSPLQSLIIL